MLSRGVSDFSSDLQVTSCVARPFTCRRTKPASLWTIRLPNSISHCRNQTFEPASGWIFLDVTDPFLKQMMADEREGVESGKAAVRA